ncbi:hypothetical protein G6F37_002210 [Rhizopus arrhizus]|nr:hypothetical protein G6F38_007594 [Rhizopus arrhizus]KAG1162370.1 hypothetical protein G6F37_002210 [Rhizopus arrhizus]
MRDNDEEYGPLASTWGSQLADSSWHTLADPQDLPGPNGLGSGQLHRQGKNFIPISEQHILAHRLQQTKKKLTPKESKSVKQVKKKPTSTSISTTPTYSSTVQLSKNTPASKIKETNHWNSKKLVETPFWKEKEDPSTTASWIKEVKKSGEHQKKPTRVVVSILESKTDRHKEARPFIRQKVPPVNNCWIKSAEAPVDLGLAKPKVTVEDWAKAVEDTHDGWAAFDATQMGSDHWELITESSSEWGKTSTDDKSETYTSDWPSCSDDINSAPTNGLGGWGQAAKSPSQIKNTGNVSNNFIQDTSKLENNKNTTKKAHTFSHPSKKKSSDHSNKPLDTSPPTNEVLITVNVELSDTLKIPVKIRELDEPKELAKEFVVKHNMNTANIIQALTHLFESQKSSALRQRNKMLLRKKNYQAPDYFQTKCSPSSQENVYNKHTYTSSSTTSKNSFYMTTQTVPYTGFQYY